MNQAAMLLPGAFGFLVILAVFTAIVLLIDRHFPLLRDAPTIASPDPHATSYSLGRVQMTFWTVLAATAFVHVFAMWFVEWLHNPGTLGSFVGDFNPNVVALLGISGATGLVTAAVDAQKDAAAQTATSALRGAINVLVGNGRQLVALLARLGNAATAPSVANALIGQNLQALRTQRAQCAADVAKHGDVIRRNRRTARHTTFWTDVLTDENGNSLHRLQMVLFTLLYGCYFAVTVIAEKKVGAAISDQALQLMGVSNLVYVGFKLPGRSPTS